MMTDEPFDEHTSLWLQRRVEAYEKSIRSSHKTYEALLRRAAISQLMLDDVQKLHAGDLTVDYAAVDEVVDLKLRRPDDPYLKWALVMAPVEGTGNAIAVTSAVRAVRQAKTIGAVTAAKKRHEAWANVKAHAIELFRERQWLSTPKAAKAVFEILDPITEDKYGVRFSRDRGRQTVYEWFLKDKKNHTPAR